MRSSAPVIVGGGIVCAMGAHLPSVMTAITAGIAGLSVEAPYGEESIRLGVACGLLRETKGAGQMIAMLADAVDYSLSSLGDMHLGRYAAVFAVPRAPSCRPSTTVDTDVTDAVTAAGVRAAMAALLAERRHAPEVTRVFVGPRAGGQSIEAAVELLGAHPDLDGCLVAASDPHTRAFTAEEHLVTTDLPPGYAAGDAAAALWLLRPKDIETGPRLLSVQSGHATDPRVALRLAIVGALENADHPLGDLRHLVHDTPWGDLNQRRRRAGLHDDLPGDWWSPAQSIGDVGVAQAVIQTLHATSLTQRWGGGQSALVLLSDETTIPTAWVVSAPAVTSPHCEGRVPCAL